MVLKDKKICITGGSGFLGTNLKNYFEKKKVNVFIPRSTDYDLCKFGDAQRMITDSKPDIIIHAAADIGGIEYNRMYPADVFRNNLSMAINILEVARRNNIEKVTSIGSACAYPGYVAGELKEENLLNGPMHESVEVYGFSKRALYLGARAYKQQYGLDSIFLALSHIYGPYDKYDPEEKESHVLAALIRKFVKAKQNGGKKVICWGTGKPIREFLYVEDCAEAIYLATESYNKLEPLNIGTGIGTTIKELAETIKDITKFKGQIIWDTSKPDGANEKVLNINKMQKELNWKPETGLREGIQKTIGWCVKEGIFN